MLTYKQLLRIIPYKKSVFNDRKNKVHTSVTKVEVVGRGGKEGIKFHATGRAHTEKVYYPVEIEMYPAIIASAKGLERYKSANEDTHCWVKCGCPFFKFHCAWVLSTNYGSSELGDCLDRPPKITNPEMKVYVCKHLHAILPIMLKQIQGLAMPSAKKK